MPYLLAVHPKVQEVYTVENVDGSYHVQRYDWAAPYGLLLGTRDVALEAVETADTDAREPLDWYTEDAPGESSSTTAHDALLQSVLGEY